MDTVQQYRSGQLKIVCTETLDTKQFLQLIGVIANSFAINEPMARHVMPPKHSPTGIIGIKHEDPFGNWIGIFIEMSKN